MDSAQWTKIKETFSAVAELPLDERAAILQSFDPLIRDEVEKLLAANDSAGDFIASPIHVENGHSKFTDEAMLGHEIDDYVILEKIGEGGMGTVYLAEHRDQEFLQRVALKLIKRGMDTNAVLKRFFVERQILASLDHRNIARLLDGGSTEHGLPYLVMELVEGENIRSFCDEHRYGTNERLQLFLKVCHAISYAHQKLIVHRDIKPSNIVVTDSGEPKLLDFGIAKLLSPDWDATTTEATATNFRLMTPEYASPEQLRGQMTTTATDVYSLGVVLYELLTGERPYKFISKDPFEISREILTIEPPRPSSVVSGQWSVVSNGKATHDNNRSTAKDQRPKTENQSATFRTPHSAFRTLRGDLDNIILKSIRKDPKDRYKSVEELAEDIDRYLNGMPVRATADSRTYRFKKFVARNRVGTAVAALILFLSGVAGWQAVAANRQRAAAERRFEQVRKLANTVLFEYHDGIATLPGATAMREKMLTDSLDFLNNLSAESLENQDLRREVARAYKKVGDLQGASDTGNVGKTQAALQSYQKALAIQETILAENPENAEDVKFVGELLIEIGSQHRDLGDLPYAEKSFTSTLEVLSKMPEDSKKQSLQAMAFWNIASLRTAQNNLDTSLEYYQKALEIYEKLGDAEPSEKKYRRNAALTHKNIGSVLQLRGEAERAIPHFRQALTIDLENAQNNPHDVSAQLDLSFTYGTLASVLRDAKDFQGSLENSRRAMAIRENIYNADNKNAFAENAVARGFQELGRTYLAQEKYMESERNFAKAQSLYQKIADSDPGNTTKKARLAENLALLGYVNGLNLNLGKANEFFEKSLTIYADLLNQEKLSTLEQRRFVAAYLGYGEVLLKDKQTAKALENLNKAQELLQNEKVGKDAEQELEKLEKLLIKAKK